jgi:hypothetical protein
MTRTYNCWKCDHFMPENVLTSLAGRCTRRAPRGLSQNGLKEIWFNAGLISEFLIGGPGLMTVISRGGVFTTTHLVWFEDTEGMNDNDSFPWVIPAGYKLTKLVVALSRANTGAASVGTAPVLNINVAQVGGTAMTNLATVPVPIDPAHCHEYDHATDDFVISEYDLPVPVAIGMGLWGLRIDLTTASDPNVITQLRNPMIGALARYDPELTDALSKNKYALIPDGTANRCGKFKPAIGIIPVVPEV